VPNERREFGYVLASQTASSGSNVLPLAAAQFCGPTCLGGTSIVLTFYQLGLGLFRSIFADVSLANPETEMLPRLRMTVMISSVFSVVSVVVGLIWFPDLRGPLSVLALAFPVLFAQDIIRYRAFIVQHAVPAAATDIVWFVVFAAELGIMWAFHHTSTLSLIITWVVACAVSIGPGLLVEERMMRRTSPTVDQRPLTRSPGLRLADIGNASRLMRAQYVGEFAIGMVMSIGPSAAVGAVGGSVSYGLLRLGQALLGPAAVLYSGLCNYFMPRIAVRRGTSLADEIRISFFTVLTVVVWGGVLVGAIAFATPRFGSKTWADLRPWVLAVTAAYAAQSLSGGALAGMRARGMQPMALRLRVVAAIALTTTAGPMFARWGISGYAWSLVGVGVIVSSVAWWQLARAVRVS
jgi:O-antigen/teichoic acid export membrane protein